MQLWNMVMAPLTVTATITYQGAASANQSATVAGDRVHFDMPIADPHLWWPAGMGLQPLYDIELILKDAKGAAIDHRKRGLVCGRLSCCEDGKLSTATSGEWTRDVCQGFGLDSAGYVRASGDLRTVASIHCRRGSGEHEYDSLLGRGILRRRCVL